MLKIYYGSCYCGCVVFEVDMDFVGISKCNCWFCWKQWNWGVVNFKFE